MDRDFWFLFSNFLLSIIHEFSDGDRLSDDDQKFILESVFSYHPDKQSKVADQLDYIMVSNADFRILIKSYKLLFVANLPRCTAIKSVLCH